MSQGQTGGLDASRVRQSFQFVRGSSCFGPRCVVLPVFLIADHVEEVMLLWSEPEPREDVGPLVSCGLRL